MENSEILAEGETGIQGCKAAANRVYLSRTLQQTTQEALT